jgi:hypothetical protein
VDDVRELSEKAFSDLIVAMKIKPGHVSKMYKAFGNVVRDEQHLPPPPPPPPPPPQPPPPIPPKPPPIPPGDCELQGKLKRKLLELNTFTGLRKEGYVIDTLVVSDTQSSLTFHSDLKFYCLCCSKANLRSADGDGSRAVGINFTGIKAHLGSKDHWTAFRFKYHSLPYDEAAWLHFNALNPWGAKRVKMKIDGTPTVAAAKRLANTALTAQRCPKQPKQEAPSPIAQPFSMSPAAPPPPPAAAAAAPPPPPPPPPPAPNTEQDVEQAWAERRAAEINSDNSGVAAVPSTATIPIAEVLAAPAAEALAAPAAEALAAPAAEALAAPAAEALHDDMPAVVMAAVATPTLGWSAATTFAVANSRSY